jgi:predicted nucleic acid-binding Zn ribbon protein
MVEYYLEYDQELYPEMLYHGQVKQTCEVCGKEYRPRSGDQRFCGRECRLRKKAQEARAARRVWWLADRPSEERVEAMMREREARQG